MVTNLLRPAASRPSDTTATDARGRHLYDAPHATAAAGKDSTQDFEEIGHSNSAREILEKYYIGTYEVRRWAGRQAGTRARARPAPPGPSRARDAHLLLCDPSRRRL